jgi:hypothetical protein
VGEVRRWASERGNSSYESVLGSIIHHLKKRMKGVRQDDWLGDDDVQTREHL